MSSVIRGNTYLKGNVGELLCVPVCIINNIYITEISLNDAII